MTFIYEKIKSLVTIRPKKKVHSIGYMVSMKEVRLKSRDMSKHLVMIFRRLFRELDYSFK